MTLVLRVTDFEVASLIGILESVICRFIVTSQPGVFESQGYAEIDRDNKNCVTLSEIVKKYGYDDDRRMRLFPLL